MTKNHQHISQAAVLVKNIIGGIATSICDKHFRDTMVMVARTSRKYTRNLCCGRGTFGNRYLPPCYQGMLDIA